jgi:dienelactone hydrolase
MRPPVNDLRIGTARSLLIRVGRARTDARRIAAAALLMLAACGGKDSSTLTAPSQASASNFTGVFPSSGANLHYELDLPSGSGPFPAVVFGHGSGPVTKVDGAVHVPFWLGQGFAVLRFDKRGAGQSTGAYRGVSAANSQTQILELAGDMAAAVAFLQTRPNIDGRRVGLTGVSQAGWVMAAATMLSSDVRFVVAFVGSVVPVGVNIAYENLRAAPIDEAYAALARYAGPEGYDPRAALRATVAPVLYLLGADDRLVPTRACAPLVDSLRDGGARVGARVYPSAGHELGSSTRAWPDIATWLRAEGLR